MKKFQLTTYLLFIAVSLYAQQPVSIHIDNPSNNLLEKIPLKQQFLDSIFLAGKITYKNGTYSSAFFNYNLISNGVYFVGKQNVAYMVDGLSKVLFISYGKRIFMPLSSNAVAEVLSQYSNGDILLLERKSDLTNLQQKKGPYGTSTETSSSENVDLLTNYGTHTTLDHSIQVNITQIINYYIVRGSKRTPIRNFKDLKKLYPEAWDKVEKNIALNKPNFKSTQDFKAVVDLCN